MTPYSSFSKLSDFTVHDTIEVIDSFNIPIDSKLPDHRLISWKFSNPSLASKCYKSDPGKPRVIKSVPPAYLKGENASEEVNSLIDRLDNLGRDMDDLDSIYSSFCEVIDSQLDCRTVKPRRQISKESPNKQWWNEGLSDLA